MTKRSYLAFAATILFATLFAFVSIAFADHSWGGYHWARKANPFTVKLGDNVTATWDSYLVTASQDWNKNPETLSPGSGIAKVLNTAIVAGNAGKNCKATNGMVQVCNSRYGNNGWLGIASIWLSGAHITAGTVKMNDTYFNTPTYNTTAWKNLVMCQEVGHTFGLDHQDETFGNTNLGTCMDYTNNPATNQHPNQHDYEELALIYSHFDAITTLSNFVANSAADVDDTDDPKKWGKEIRRSADGHSSVFEEDKGNGNKVLRHVFWAEPRGNDKHHDE